MFELAKATNNPNKCSLRGFKSITFGVTLIFALLSAPLADLAHAQATKGSGGGIVTSTQNYAMSWVTWLGSWVSWSESSISAEATAFRDAVVDDAQVLEDLIARTGFDLAEIRVGVGLIPSIALGVGGCKTNDQHRSWGAAISASAPGRIIRGGERQLI